MTDDYQIESTAAGENELDKLFAQWMNAGTTAATPDGATVETETPVPMPSNIDVFRSTDSITISRRWFSNAYVFTLFFGIVWNAILIPFFGAFLSFGSMGGFGAIFILFLLPFVAVGVGMIYYSIAGFLNRTTITVKDGTLSVTHAPVPWPGSTSIPAAEISQLFTQEVRHTHTSSSRTSNSMRRSRRTSYTYTVKVIAGSEGREHKLVSSLTDANQGLFIEYTIERFLGIADRHVRGEIRKD